MTSLRHGSYIMLLCVLVGILVSSIGCGNGNTTTTTRHTGIFYVAVDWPPYVPSKSTSSTNTQKSARSGGRIVEPNATSIAIIIHLPANQGGDQNFTVTRTDPSHTFALPVGTFSVDVFEYADSSLVPIAQALNQSITVNENNTPSNPARLTISPESTIATLKCTPTQITGLAYNQTTTLSASAWNTNNNLVPVPVGSIAFSSDNPTVANVDPSSGIVLSKQYGTANIVATLSNSLFETPPSTPVTASTSVATVVSIAISPLNPVTLAPVATSNYANQQVFTATVSGDVSGSNSGVRWSIQEGSSGGTLTNATSTSVTYTAPNPGSQASSVGGTYHLIATSNTDNITQTVATINIVAGSLTVNAN